MREGRYSHVWHRTVAHKVRSYMRPTPYWPPPIKAAIFAWCDS